jgi:formylglycine-generating enzyme required for sulfatase activity
MSARVGRLSSLLIGFSLSWASPSPAVSIDWVTVGNPGNSPDTAVMTDNTTGYGSVAYAYQISKYEVTNAQYAEFLNAVAVGSDYGLYNAQMDSSPYGGITQSGSAGSFSYAAKAGFEQKPVNFVSFLDAASFANWLNNGQPLESPEDPPLLSSIYYGAYDLYGPNPVTRNPGATIFLPGENEWYKAAYYDSSSSGYFLWPTGTNAFPSCGAPTAVPNSANCEDNSGPPNDLVPVGSYAGSPSPYGTFDQGGNVWEWNEGDGANFRQIHGGSFDQGYGSMVSEFRGPGGDDGSGEIASIGFRVAAVVPEPSTGALFALGLLGLAARRRSRTSAGS